jgi:predicted metalloprotease with PDZ domain
LAELLRSFAVDLNLRPREKDRNKGGRPARNTPASVWLGVTLTGGSDARLRHIFNGGPAARAGLATGDVIVAVDGLRASPESLERLRRGRAPGELVSVQAFRRDELMSFGLTLEAAPRIRVGWPSPTARKPRRLPVATPGSRLARL